MKMLVVALGLALLLTGASAQDARQIVAEVQKRSAAVSQQYEGRLQVIDSSGRTSEKRWTYERLGSHGTSRTVIRFSDPPEVRGVALLIVNHPDRVSDQWMWTPAINRERRIAAQDRRTRFFGTDFTFEDLDERAVDHYDYTLQGDDTVDGEACWRIESTPRAGRRSQYSKSVVWIRKGNYTYARIDNYVKDSLIRRLHYRDVQQVQSIWTARRLEMQDFSRNSRTILELESLNYNAPLGEDRFTLEALRRG